MLVVVALGGNALLRRGEPMHTDVLRANLRSAATAIAEIADEHQVVVTHGNGPQVGLLALQAEAYRDAPAPPLDVLGAESEGMIGYLIEQELGNALPGRALATLLTLVEVDPLDPAFTVPTKPIGPTYDEDAARTLARQRGWTVAPDVAGFRRVVPSPEPLRIREASTIQVLLDANRIVICAGGGGIPVVVTPSGGVRGVEAVVDKDLASALLAAELGADALLLLTDVPAVFADWPDPMQEKIRETTPLHLRALTLDPGSMGPKVEAACRFVERGGMLAGIGGLSNAAALLAGETGTIVRTD